MTLPRSSGVTPAPSSGADDPLRGRLGAANMQQRAVGFGQVLHLKPVGGLNAVYSIVDLGKESQANVNVPHNLGQIPVWCMLLELNGNGTNVMGIGTPVRKDLWTVTSCRMALYFNIGGMTGTTATFLVAGA